MKLAHLVYFHPDNIVKDITIAGSLVAGFVDRADALRFIAGDPATTSWQPDC